MHLQLSDPSLGLTERGGSVEDCRLTSEAARMFYFKTPVSMLTAMPLRSKEWRKTGGAIAVVSVKSWGNQAGALQLGVSGEESKNRSHSLAAPSRVDGDCPIDKQAWR